MPTDNPNGQGLSGIVFVISDASNAVEATVPVGADPAGAAYDSAKGEVFVTDYDANNVSVISDTTNMVVATVPVGIGPNGVGYDSSKGELFVTNNSVNTVSIISDGSTTTTSGVPRFRRDPRHPRVRSARGRRPEPSDHEEGRRPSEFSTALSAGSLKPMQGMSYLLGIDDTDSRFGHCTTHLGYLIVCELARIGCTFSTYPRLVRLNPNISFKTRGNAAVCIEFEARSDDMRDEAFRAAERLLEAEADVCERGERGARHGIEGRR